MTLPNLRQQLRTVIPATLNFMRPVASIVVGQRGRVNRSLSINIYIQHKVHTPSQIYTSSGFEEDSAIHTGISTPAARPDKSENPDIIKTAVISLSLK
jgi:hypothetical protein